MKVIHQCVGATIALCLWGCHKTVASGNDDRDTGSDPAAGDENTLLIDDCDDGDAENLLGGAWVSYDDYHDDGDSVVWPKTWFKDGEFTMSEPGYGGEGYAARIEGTTAAKLGWDYVGMIAALGPDSFCPDPQPAAVDLNAYTGVRFMARGRASGGVLSVKIIHTKDGAEDNCEMNGLTGDTLTGWNDYSAEFTDRLEDDWTEVSLSFRRDFQGPDDVDIETVLEHAKDLHFFFQSSDGGEVDLSIDNLSLYKGDEPEDEGDDFDRSGEPEELEDLEGNEAAALFDRQTVHEVRLSLPADAWETLQREAVDELYTPADITLMGETFGEVGLRFKGSYGSLYNCFDGTYNLICDKLSMKVKFNEYVEEQRFLGLKRINLHSMHNDRTKMRDCLAYDIFRGMGIPAPRCAYADVYVNDEHLGLFGLVEQIDGRFTQSRFSKGDGNLYKEAWPVSTQDWYFDDKRKTNKEEMDHRVFKQFAKEMMAATDEELPGVLDLWMDLDYILRYMAVDYAIANWDGITTFYCGVTWDCVNHNYYMYQEEERPFFWLIPWDLEASFFLEHWLGPVEPWDNLDPRCEDIPMMPGETDMYIRPAGCDPMNRAIALADRPRYEAYLGEVLETHLGEEAMLEKIAALTTLIEPYIETDPDLDVETWQAEIETQIAELGRVRGRVEAELK